MTASKALQLSCGIVASVTLPLAAHATLGLGWDRDTVSSIACVVFVTALNALFAGPLFLGTRALGRRASMPQRIEEASLVFLIGHAVIALTWELGWLVVYPHLDSMRDTYVGYTWWVYIDAGDRRYLTAPTDLIVMEYLSVINAIAIVVGVRGVLGSTRRKQTCGGGVVSRRVVGAKATVSQLCSYCLVLAVVSAVHLYSALLYYGVEVAQGCPSCDWDRPLNVISAFVLANLPWVYMPFVVLRWLRDVLRECMGAS